MARWGSSRCFGFCVRARKGTDAPTRFVSCFNLPLIGMAYEASRFLVFLAFQEHGWRWVAGCWFGLGIRLSHCHKTHLAGVGALTFLVASFQFENGQIRLCSTRCDVLRFAQLCCCDLNWYRIGLRNLQSICSLFRIADAEVQGT